MTETAEALRRIPKIDALTERLGEGELAAIPRPIVVEVVRGLVDDVRRQVVDGSLDGTVDECFQGDRLIAEVGRRIGAVLGRRHRSVINATGILLHTGLGRAPLSQDAVDAAADAARYAIVEVDPLSGERDLREERIARLLCELTGAEAATVVNNNAAACLVALRALGAGGEVIASRGEMVEIGGGFRMPAVMQESGCRLREVGTTNRTYARDYDAAVTDETTLLLKVHTSNYRVVGFTHEPSVRELKDVAATRGLPFVYDLGSGLIRAVDVAPLEDEPTVSDAVRDGADVVTFSGDKLLCGPQAGMLVGKKELIDRMRGSALFRAVRPGKLDLAALEATLLAYRRAATGLPDLPLYRALARPIAELREIATRLRDRLASIDGVRADVVDTDGFLGSGSAPVKRFAGVAVAIDARGRSARAVTDALRRLDPPVFARIEDDRVFVDLRAVFDDQLQTLTDAVVNVLGGDRS